MLNKVKHNFNTGLMRIKWIASFVAERTKAETSVAKLLYESHKLEDKIENLYREIGRRVLELKEKEEKDIFQDAFVQESLDEVKKLREAVAEYKKQAKNIHKLSD